MNTEHALDPSEVHHLLLEELKDVGVFSMDLDRLITSWSPGVERILGYSEAAFVGQNGTIIFTPEDREQKEDDREFDLARLEGRSPDIRWHMKNDGSRTFVDGVLRSVSDKGGKHVGYSKIMRHVGPTGSMLTSILERTPDVIFLKDRKGRFTYVNSETSRMLGRDAKDILGHTSEEFFPPHISGPIHDDDANLMENNTPRIIEERMLDKDYGERTFLSGKAAWSDSNGSIIGVVCIAQDISARKELERERERLLLELRRSNEDLAQFSYVVSHDLQTPLRTVRSYTQLLAKRYKGKLDDTADQFISVIQAGAGRMEQLILALLRYAQVGEEPIQKTPVGIDAILDGVRSNLQSLFDENSAQLTHGALPTVLGDPVQLLQLFQNLIGNAIKYAKPGVKPRINISVEKMESGHYNFAVRDNGLGIEPPNFERIFAPLKRLHGQEIPGTGIGLAVCKKIVERHDGRIWVTSERGKGSTFHFTLPCSLTLKE